MEQRRLGLSDVTISAVVLGTWQAGKHMWVGIDDGEIARAMRAAYEAGIRAVDTAEFYGKGHSERMVGKHLRDVRQHMVYATKVFPTHLEYKKVKEACHRSLGNLETDYIDLYQIHWPAGSFGTKKVPVEDTMAAMNDLKQEGKIRAIGVSNFSREQLEEAHRVGPIDSLQPPYSLFWRQVESDAMPFCLENRITILGYSSLAQGLLTGKSGAEHRFEKGDHRSKNRLFEPENYRRVQEAIERLRPIASRKGVTLAQLALAWLIAQPGTCAIAGARNENQARENAAAARVALSPEDLEEIDCIGRTVTDHLDSNPVMWSP